MIEIEKPTIECVYDENDPCYGKFVVEPLERGYGNTIGNSLMGALPPMAENGVTAPEGTLVSVLTDDTQAVDCRRLVEALGGRIL